MAGPVPSLTSQPNPNPPTISLNHKPNYLTAKQLIRIFLRIPSNTFSRSPDPYSDHPKSSNQFRLIPRFRLLCLPSDVLCGKGG
eukprot:1361279-Amorphochlora_amoeboformis.AAC.1